MVPFHALALTVVAAGVAVTVLKPPRSVHVTPVGDVMQIPLEPTATNLAPSHVIEFRVVANLSKSVCLVHVTPSGDVAHLTPTAQN